MKQLIDLILCLLVLGIGPRRKNGGKLKRFFDLIICLLVIGPIAIILAGCVSIYEMLFPKK